MKTVPSNENFDNDTKDGIRDENVSKDGTKNGNVSEVSSGQSEKNFNAGYLHVKEA